MPPAVCYQTTTKRILMTETAYIEKKKKKKRHNLRLPDLDMKINSPKVMQVLSSGPDRQRKCYIHSMHLLYTHGVEEGFSLSDIFKIC